jgi:predicted GIY-YIG superfamily endonuclease
VDGDLSDILAEAERLRQERRLVESVETALYSYYDAADISLYIGITDDLRRRTLDHVEASSWMAFAARSTITRYPTRVAALDAEKIAIEIEQPLFNSQHNSTPEARQRLVAYLVEKGRLDLLTPAVSRG